MKIAIQEFNIPINNRKRYIANLKNIDKVFVEHYGKRKYSKKTIELQIKKLFIKLINNSEVEFYEDN